MSRPLYLPHSFGLILFKTSVGYRIGYSLHEKRFLPLFVQSIIITTFNTIACMIIGHEYLAKALMREDHNCLHCNGVKICPDCNGTGTNYFVPSPMRGAKKEKTNTVPVTLFDCKTCGGLGRM